MSSTWQIYQGHISVAQSARQRPNDSKNRVVGKNKEGYNTSSSTGMSLDSYLGINFEWGKIIKYLTCSSSSLKSVGGGLDAALLGGRIASKMGGGEDDTEEEEDMWWFAINRLTRQ